MPIPHDLMLSVDTLDDADRSRWHAVYTDVFAETGDQTKAALAAWGAVQKTRVLQYYGVKSASGAPVIGGWGMLFTDASNPDVDQQFFDDQTKTFLELAGRALWYEHGQDAAYGVDPIGERVYEKAYQWGIWTEHTLYDDHPLYKRTQQEIEDGLLVLSSDSAMHYVRQGLDETTGYLGSWPLLGWSLTHNPAEPALGAVTFQQFATAVKAATEAREAQSPRSEARKDPTRLNTHEGKPMKAMIEGLAAFFDVENDAAAVKSSLDELITKLTAALDDGAGEPAPEGEKAEGEEGAVVEGDASMPDMAQLRAALGLGADAGNGEIISRLQEMLALLAEQPEMKSYNFNGLAAALGAAAKSTTPVDPALPKLTRQQEPGMKNVNLNKGAKIPGLARLVQGIVGGKSESAMKAMGYSIGSNGGYFLRQEVANEMIELFRASTVVDKLGATYVPMNGIETLTYRKQLTGATATYRGEAQSGNQSDLTFGVVNLQLKELFAGVRLNRRLLRNSEENLEAMINRDLNLALSLRADLAALVGTGGIPNETGATGAEPRGIRNTTGVTSTNLATNGAVPTVKNFVDAWGRLEDANVPSASSWGAAMSPRTRRTLENLTDTTGQLLDVARWTQGHKVETTTQIVNTRTVGTSTDTSEVYLGDWQYLIYGLGQDVEIIVDESVYRLSGEVYIEATLMHDVGVAQPTAFQILAGARA